MTMLTVVQYSLSPNEEQRQALLGLCGDYADLRNRMLGAVSQYTTVDIRTLSAAVNELLDGEEGIPTRYISLAERSVIWHLKRNPEVKFDAWYSVDLDAAVATPTLIGTISKTIPQLAMSIKMFHTKKRERLLVPCSYKSTTMAPASKVGGAVLQHDNGYEWTVLVTVEVPN